MTDLVKRFVDQLRQAGGEAGVQCDECLPLADAIEALTAERDQWIQHAKNAVWADSEEVKALTADNARLKSVVARFGLMFAGSVSVTQEDGRIVAVIVPPKGAVSHAALTGKEPSHE